MDKRPMKTVGESRTEQVQIVLPGHSNGDGRLFGGRLMEWIDVVAAVVARRHSGVNVTTAARGQSAVQGRRSYRGHRSARGADDLDGQHLHGGKGGRVCGKFERG